MTTPPKAADQASRPAGNRNLLVTVVVLFVIFGFLFARSFAPGQVVFANDGPLGAISSMAADMKSGFTGVWQDLNWIGTQVPAALPHSAAAVWFLLGDSPVAFSKFHVPLALIGLGLAFYATLRIFGLGPVACSLGAFAAALNMNVFSHAAWGLPSRAWTLASIFLAIAALRSGQRSHPLVKALIAGLCVGNAVMEGFDVGAILSLYVAAFAVFVVMSEPGAAIGRKAAQALGRVALVAVFAGLCASAALATLISTQIQGVAGMDQDERTREQRWDAATMWSLPKTEALRILIPGLFGYRMDTPDGGNYWGAVGQQPGWNQHRQGMARHSGSGEYAGVLVVLLALWAFACSVRKDQKTFSPAESRFIWFWAAAAVISLLFAFGRHAPFYQLVYALPYFSTVRNPIKFMHPFHLSMLILFAYGVEGLIRSCVRTKAPGSSGGLRALLKSWWARAASFERKWTISSGVVVAASLLGLLLYASSRRELENHLQHAGFPPELVPNIAAFSLREAALFWVFLSLSAGAVILVMSGLFARSRVWAGVILGLVLVTDLARANTPWIIYYDYREKYATNPVLNILRETPYQHRVAARMSPMSPNYLATEQARSLFAGIAEEWLQHQFQFFNVQSLDIVQMPRMPELDATYMAGILSPLFAPSEFLQLESFLSKLRSRSDPVSRFLWEQFSVEGRTALEKTTDGAGAAPILAQELNRVIRTAPIYDPARFAGVRLSEEIRAVLQSNGAGRDVARVNRSLLEEVYPAELGRRSQLQAFGRLWQLTNTRRILGMTPFLDLINQQIDPIHRSFRVHTAFDFAPREPLARDAAARIEDITTVLRPEGQFAVFEFGAALPRTKLFTQWQVLTNEEAGVLERLADPAFDPHNTVLISDPIPAPPSAAANAPTGSVSVVHYEPKRILLKVDAGAPSVLLWNDKYDPSWKVRVDGNPAPLLRCNYIMRGVYLQPGQHEIELHFDPPHWALYVSLAGIAAGLGLCGMLAFSRRAEINAKSGI